MEFHPVASIFPLLQGPEFEELKADIARNGLRESIWLHPDGRILDGRNRWRACVETNTNAGFRTWDEAIHGPLVAFVVSLNLHRRHLESSQRAAIAVDVLPMLEDEARERIKEGAKIGAQITNFGERPSQKFDKGDDGIKECSICNNLYDGIAFPDTCPYCFKERHNLPGWVDNLPELIKNGNNGRATQQAAQLFHTNRQYVSDAKKLKEDSPALFEQVKNGILTIPQAKQEIARQRIPGLVTTPPLPAGKYRCIVLDPPWPMKKIEREERPNQGLELDYPTMSLEAIEALPIRDLADESGCHLYLWVTQKYLPFGLELVKRWGFDYQCLMTWRKNVGITPFSWMYDTEHVIYAHCGSLPLQQLGLRLSFDAPVNGHSAKPDVFYQGRVRLASPEPRLDMFSRKEREGFEVWGNEV